MKKINCLKSMLLLTVILFFILGANNTALGYGGSEGSQDTEADASSKNQKITKLSDEEVKKIFSLLDAKSKETMSNVFSGTDKTARELMTIRQWILEGDMSRANAEADLINVLTVTVEYLDKAGQWSQLGLSFVPGIGWVIPGVLDTVRGGADAYKKGKSATEILSEAAMAGISSVTINKLSPLGADTSFNNAKLAYTLAKKGSKKAVKRLFVNAAKFGAKKGIEKVSGDGLKETLNNASKKAPNRVPRPTYINSSMGYDVTKTGMKLYK